MSDPNVLQHQPLQGAAGAKHGDYSAAAVDNRNVAAQAGEAAARAAGDHQKHQAHKQAGAVDRKADFDPTVLERIVAEEREAKGKLPRYPGLERWTLVEKMGDGAFSNVYRARDNNGQYGEVAIKVVRKFEMNSSQVSITPAACPPLPISLSFSSPFVSRARLVCVFKIANESGCCRAIITCIPTLRRCQKLWRSEK